MVPSPGRSDRYIPAPDKHLLWALSGGICAAPACATKLVEESGTKRVTIGKMAHIHAHSPGGPRWIAPVTNKYLDSYNNLILLCEYHHTIIDRDEESYPAEKIRAWKREHEQRVFASSSHPLSTALANTAPPLALTYIDRASLSTQLENALRRSPLVALVGLSGSGKTQLATRYFDSVHQGSLKVWINASSKESIEAQLSDIAVALEPTLIKRSSISLRARWALERIAETRDALCVFDGAPSIEAVHDLVPRGTDVIVTSQRQGWPGFRTIQVGPMSDEESLSLLMAVTHQDSPHLTETAELSNNHPLVLTQAGRYIANQGIDAGAMNVILRSDYAAVVERGAMADELPFTKVLDKVVEALNPTGTLLAQALSLLSDTPLPLEPIEGLADPLDAYSSRVGLEDALAPLLDYSLITRGAEGVQMHSLVSAHFRRMGQGDDGLSIVLAYALILSQMPRHSSSLRDRALYHLLIPHAVALLQNDEAEASPMRHVLANRVGSYYTEIGEPGRAEFILREALRATESEWGLRGSLIHNLANATFEAGRLEEAASLASEALETKESERAGQPSAHLAYTHSLLGDILYALGDVEGAIASNRAAAELFEQDEEPVQAAGALMTVAGCLMELSPRQFVPVVEVIRAAKSLLEDGEGPYSYAHQVRLAMIQAEFAIRTANYARAACHARDARKLAVSAELPLDEARGIVLHTQALVGLNPLYDPVQLLERGVRAADRASDVGVVPRERVRGNLAIQFAVCGRWKRGLELAKSSLVALEGALPEGHPTIRIARKIVDDMAEPGPVERKRDE